MASQFRLHRPNKDKKGVAIAFQLSYKEAQKFDPWQLFLVAAPQVENDDKGNNRFDWKENAITVKLGEPDIGELISVLEGRKDFVGSKGSLFHETPGGGNKVVDWKRGDNGGFYFSVSAQDKDKNKTGPYRMVVSDSEASILLVLLKRAIENMFGW